MKQMRRTFLLAAAAGLASFLSFPGASFGQGEKVVVLMTDQLRFEPGSITIPAGTTVEWVNVTTLIGHSATADPAEAFRPSRVVLPLGAETFDSGLLPPGARFEHTFTVPGRYVYFCVPHEMDDMYGEIIVE